MRNRIVLKIQYLLLLFLSNTSVNAQEALPFLSYEQNAPCIGDVLYLYKAQGRIKEDIRNGENIWDLAELSISDNPMLRSFLYDSDSTSLCITADDTERFKFTNNTLQSLGYHAQNVAISYTYPRLYAKYPFAYKDSISSFFFGEGLYSQLYPLSAYGSTTLVADAYGSLILPEGDTLKQVLHVRETTSLGQHISNNHSGIVKVDSCNITSFEIRRYIQEDSVSWVTETERWYASGWRYPIVERLKTYIKSQTELSPHATLTYYIPAYCQYGGMQELSDFIHSSKHYIHKVIKGSTTKKNSTIEESFISDKQPYYFSEDKTKLYISFETSKNSDIECQLSTASGIVLYRSGKQRINDRFFETILLPNKETMPAYILSISENGVLHSFKLKP